ncbi:MAG: ABC transporter ATP-binding protein [Candidatus Berkiella sp.]
MITLNNIHVEFQAGTTLAKHILKGINLTVKCGEFITLIGGNGAGKSTLMNMLAGVIFPSQGEIYFNQQNVTNWPAHRRAPHIARLFQDPMQGTFAHLTLLENIALALKRGQKRGLGLYLSGMLRKRAKELLAPLGLGLENSLHSKVSTLSGGQRQALSLVMATICEADILLLDEHTAALDPKTAQQILDMTCQLVDKHQLTTLMITHSLTQALSVGDRTLVLSEGTIVEDLSRCKKEMMQAKDLMRYFI